MVRKVRTAAKTAILAVAIVLGSSGLSAHAARSGSYDKPAGINLSGGSYEDGTYYGTSLAFRPGLKVEVTVKGGRVASISVIEHHEVDKRFYALPIKVIPAEIVKKQSTMVDAVSGASATSYGIMAAVEKALEGAISAH